MNNIISILKNSNKITAAWNEAALPPHNDIGSAGSAGKVDKNCIIFAWEHPDVGLMSAKKGFKTVLCPGHKTYFDMAYNNSTFERGICWAGTIEVKEVFDWKPLQDYETDEPIYNAPKVTEHRWARQDAYGIYTGLYCGKCYDNPEVYTYRKDEYFDPAYAGERLEGDY